MKCGIVILNYNNYNLTKQCVDNILCLGIEEYIVIVDNDSPNNSYDFLKEEYKENKMVDVIKTEENKGYSFGNNYGIRYIINKRIDINYIAIINPDVEVKEKNIFTDIMNKMEKRHDIALMGAVMILNGKVNYDGGYWNIPSKKSLVLDHVKFIRKRQEQRRIKYDIDNIGIVDVVPGSFFIIKTKALMEIDYLDEDTFLYNEENILAIRLFSKGYKEAISLDNFYLHNHNTSVKTKTLDEKIKINKIGYKSRKVLCDKYYDRSYLTVSLKVIHVLNIFYILVRHCIGKLLRKI